MLFLHLRSKIVQFREKYQNYLSSAYNVTMKNSKEENLRRALSHIERHKQAINTSNNSEDNDFHKLLLQFSYEVYERIKANKKPYPNLDSDKVF